MNIPKEAMEAAKTAMETVTPPPGVDRADWLKEHGPYALLAGAIAAAAPYLMAEALRDAADAIDAQRDESNPDRKPDESWSVIDHRAGRFLGKTVAARMLRARAADPNPYRSAERHP